MRARDIAKVEGFLDAFDPAKLNAVSEQLKDVLEKAFGYDTDAGACLCFIAASTLYAEHAARMGPEGDEIRIAQVEAMIETIRNEDDEPPQGAH